MTLTKDYLAERLKDDKFRAAYEEIAPEFDIARALLKYREENGMTQAELAKKIGIHRSDLSKLESAMANPTLKTLKKIAKAIDKMLSIGYEEKNTPKVETSNSMQMVHGKMNGSR